MINTVTLIGRIGRVDISDNNRAPLRFSLATDSSYKKNEEWVTETQWHNCIIFNGKERYKETLQKGQLIYCEGRIQYDKYTNKDNLESTVTIINCNRIKILKESNNAAQAENVPF